MGWNITFQKLRGAVTWVTPESFSVQPNSVVQLAATNADGQSVYYEVVGSLPTGWKLYGNGRLEVGSTAGLFSLQVKAS